MDQTEMQTWHRERERLFPVKLPAHTIKAINRRLETMDFERAMCALSTYRHEKPYKGFWIDKYTVVYDATPSAATDRAAPRPAAPPANAYCDWEGEQRAEREQYEALPTDFVAECRGWFADWGWPEGTRGWMLLCIDTFHGRPVDQYQQKPNIFSKQYELEESIRAQVEFRKERGYIDLVAALRMEIKRLGGNIDIVA